MKNATIDISKKFLGPVHLHLKTDKWDFLRSPIMKKKIILVLTSGKFLEAWEVELELALFSAFIFTFEQGGL